MAAPDSNASGAKAHDSSPKKRATTDKSSDSAANAAAPGRTDSIRTADPGKEGAAKSPVQIPHTAASVSGSQKSRKAAAQTDNTEQRSAFLKLIASNEWLPAGPFPRKDGRAPRMQLKHKKTGKVKSFSQGTHFGADMVQGIYDSYNIMNPDHSAGPPTKDKPAVTKASTGGRTTGLKLAPDGTALEDARWALISGDDTKRPILDQLVAREHWMVSVWLEVGFEAMLAAMQFSNITPEKFFKELSGWEKAPQKFIERARDLLSRLLEAHKGAEQIDLVKRALIVERLANQALAEKVAALEAPAAKYLEAFRSATSIMDREQIQRLAAMVE